MLDTIRFARYYLAFLAKVSLGLHTTRHPLGIGWRWQVWKTSIRHRY